MSLLDRLRQVFGGAGLRARALRGSGLTIVEFGTQNLLRLLSNLVLTRLLFPEAFGLMALLSVVMTGLAMFSDLGLRPAIMQDKRGDDPAFLNTAWTLQILRGIVLWLATCGLALPMASFYDEPRIAYMLPVVGLNALIMGFNSTRGATANRHLALGRLSVVSISSQVVAITVMVCVAWATGSVWALVVGGLVGSATTVLLSHTLLPGIRNRIVLERAAMTRLLGFGKYVFLASLAGFLIGQGDKAILGRYVTLAELGVFNIAYFLASVPSSMGNALGTRIVFPLYNKRPPAESAANRKSIAGARLLLSALLISGMSVLALAGPWFVSVMYDDRYAEAGRLVALIGLGAISDLMTQSYPPVFYAAGHSGRFAAFIVARGVSQTILLLVIVPILGIYGAPIAQFLSALLVYPLLIVLLRPYKAWDPRHDLMFAATSALIVFAAATFNPGLFDPYIEKFQTYFP
jgi:O-antigen/teichoic acid export membrane protein